MGAFSRLVATSPATIPPTARLANRPLLLELEELALPGVERHMGAVDRATWQK